MKTSSKRETEKQIKEFFKDIKNKTPKEVKKIKKLAMRHSIKLGDFKKKFCKKCFTPYLNPEIRIKKGFKIVKCKNCYYGSRYK